MENEEHASVDEVAAVCEALAASIGEVVVGKAPVVRRALVTLLAGGHLLIEDVPGTGKTTLAKTLAAVLAADFKRIQCTPDLLPGDIVGVSIYNSAAGLFEFRPGPVFAEIVLADEVNRSTPRTQSALLEAMQERQVTVDGETHALPSPFMVVATQNPVELEGTFELPEAQLDRFLIRTELGYPSADEEDRMLARFGQSIDQLPHVSPRADRATISRLQAAVAAVHVGAPVRTYIRTLVHASRVHDDVRLGVSPRGALALQRAAQAHAAIEARDFVLPDDVKEMAVPVLAHRLLLKTSGQLRGLGGVGIVQSIVDATEVPIEAQAGHSPEQ